MARIRVTELPRRLSEHTGQPAPSARRCADGAVNARFPAELINNRWMVDDADLDKIALALGMTLRASAPAKASRKASSAPVSVAA